ncbi:12151_t:CDS:2 [Cetraspora pellucida]|uniref:12151_t:CDS:1 n=1 Tax=Cetraspora pellucida TaxID=1433469 RepID=A0A9N8WJF8_9GLOM|nr:12151_t:CDS:2 [Cetraspora pellucida]
MAKRIHQVQVTLLEIGVLDETLHYGLYSLVGHSNNPYLPSYTCQSDIFYTKTPVHNLSWTDHNIVSQLLVDVFFFPFFFNLDQIKIFVFGIGSSSWEDWHKVVQDNIYKIEVYQNSQLKQVVEKAFLNDVWEHFSISKYIGIQLFGLDYAITQQLIKQHRVPTCVPNQWQDFSLIKTLYDYHESSIIELNSALISLYPKDYQFTNRELNAWRSMFRAADAHDITPWSYTESKVKMGHDIELGEEIQDAIKDLTETHNANIIPNREANCKLGTMHRISNWHEWAWPDEKEEAGYILARLLS